MAFTKVEKLAIDDKLLDLSDYTKTSELINIIAPVGHTMIRLDSINPATLPGYSGTTWELVSKGRMLVGADNSYPLGSTGGSANAIVVKHNHTQNAHNHTQNAHNHTQNAHNHTQNAHNHGAQEDRRFVVCEAGADVSTTTNKIKLTTDSSGRYLVYNTKSGSSTGGGSMGEHQYVANATATNNPATASNNPATAENNPTTATNNPAGESGVGKNMPPYLAVNIWVRTL